MKISKRKYLKLKLLDSVLKVKNYLYEEPRFHIKEINTQKSSESKVKEVVIERPSIKSAGVNKPNKTQIKTPAEKRFIKQPSQSERLVKKAETSNGRLTKDFNSEFGYDHDNKEILLENLKNRSLKCTACDLCQKRQNVVFGEGNPKSKIMFVGEGPGAEEDKQGKPFVGKAGQLLTTMLKAIGLEREDVYIANVVKCRPPENRNPEENEIKVCSPYLTRQIELIDPKIIVTLGNIPTKHILKTDSGITRIRGKVFKSTKRIVIPTFHPSYLLRNPKEKVKAWLDLQLIRRRFDGN